MSNYRRAFVPGGCWFFTVNLLERRNALLVDHIDVLREAIRTVRARHPIDIDAVVVLPDHIHAIWTLPPGDADFSLRWRLIKSWFARALPKAERLSAVRRARHERGIWQRRFWEHLIRDDADYARHVEYCWINPVKHGLVTKVRDWPRSSFHRDVRAGIVPADRPVLPVYTVRSAPSTRRVQGGLRFANPPYGRGAVRAYRITCR